MAKPAGLNICHGEVTRASDLCVHFDAGLFLTCVTPAFIAGEGVVQFVPTGTERRYLDGEARHPVECLGRRWREDHFG